MEAGTEIGNKAKEYMNSGRLVPDEIVTAVCDTYHFYFYMSWKFFLFFPTFFGHLYN